MGPQHGNRLQFKKGYQKEFLTVLMSKLNLSQRKLAKKLNVKRRTLRNWINEIRLLPENIFYKCIKMLPQLMSYRMFVINIYPENWGKIKGGKVRSKMKSNLTREIRIKGFEAANSKAVKRKAIGPNGEKMYNIGEKRIAELLLAHNFKYKYEPAINLGNKYAFPDFVVKNTIIERCGYSNWPSYWSRVIEKAKMYEKHLREKGKFIIIVPPSKFSLAIRKVMPHVKNIMILKENEINLLPNFIE